MGSKSSSVPMAPIIGSTDLAGERFKALFITPFKEQTSIMVSAFKMMRETTNQTAENQEVELDGSPIKVDNELTPAKIRERLCGNR